MSTVYGLFILFATIAALTESKGDNISFLHLLLLQSHIFCFVFFFFCKWENESNTKKSNDLTIRARLWLLAAWMRRARSLKIDKWRSFVPYVYLAFGFYFFSSRFGSKQSIWIESGWFAFKLQHFNYKYFRGVDARQLTRVIIDQRKLITEWIRIDDVRWSITSKNFIRAHTFYRASAVIRRVVCVCWYLLFWHVQLVGWSTATVTRRRHKVTFNFNL